MAAEQLEQAQQIARGVLVNVSADQLDQATPCAKWNVAQLIDHLVGAQHWARSAMEGGAGGETGEGSAAGDFVAAFDDAAARTLAAFREEGALARMVNPGFGDMPAAALLGLSTTDTFTHAWDLARSTGQDTDLDHALATQLLEASRAAIQPAFRDPDGNVFGPEQPAPEGASPADQLAAFLGRVV